MHFSRGLAAGLLDSLDANLAYGLKGFTAMQVLQYIASGVLGSSSFNGGVPTALLGLVLHFNNRVCGCWNVLLGKQLEQHPSGGFREACPPRDRLLAFPHG
jgi:hypothetical protein